MEVRDQERIDGYPLVVIGTSHSTGDVSGHDSNEAGSEESCPRVPDFSGEQVCCYRRQATDKACVSWGGGGLAGGFAVGTFRLTWLDNPFAVHKHTRTHPRTHIHTHTHLKVDARKTQTSLMCTVVWRELSSQCSMPDETISTGYTWGRGRGRERGMNRYLASRTTLTVPPTIRPRGYHARSSNQLRNG